MESSSGTVVRSPGTDRLLVIMAKAPQPVSVKTRLVPSLSLSRNSGQRDAAGTGFPALMTDAATSDALKAVTAFYCCLLEDTLALARSLGDVEVAIMCPASD